MTGPIREVLVETRHSRLEEDRARKVVWLIRTATQPETLEELVAAYETCFARFRPEHEDFGLIIDTRDAPGRNDPAFEAAIHRLRAQIEGAFARIVVLVRSAAGALQARRLEAADGGEAVIATEEKEALRIAAGPNLPS